MIIFLLTFFISCTENISNRNIAEYYSFIYMKMNNNDSLITWPFLKNSLNENKKKDYGHFGLRKSIFNETFIYSYCISIPIENDRIIVAPFDSKIITYNFNKGGTIYFEKGDITVIYENIKLSNEFKVGDKVNRGQIVGNANNNIHNINLFLKHNKKYLNPEFFFK